MESNHPRCKKNIFPENDFSFGGIPGTPPLRSPGSPHDRFQALPAQIAGTPRPESRRRETVLDRTPGHGVRDHFRIGESSCPRIFLGRTAARRAISVAAPFRLHSRHPTGQFPLPSATPPPPTATPHPTPQ